MTKKSKEDGGKGTPKTTVGNNCPRLPNTAKAIADKAGAPLTRREDRRDSLETAPTSKLSAPKERTREDRPQEITGFRSIGTGHGASPNKSAQ